MPHSGALPEFEDLVTRLLDKNPASRIGWADLPGHVFWKAPLPPRDMPQELLLEQFIAEHGLLPALPAEPASDRVHLSIKLTALQLSTPPPRKIPNRDLVHPGHCMEVVGSALIPKLRCLHVQEQQVTGYISLLSTRRVAA